MNTQQMKELYESGDWICTYRLHTKSTVTWHRSVYFSEVDEEAGIFAVQLIHKSHEHILNAYLDGCEVYITSYNGFKVFNYPCITSTFIKNYNKRETYLAVPKSLENCYCKVSDLHYDKLTELGRKTHVETDPNLVYAMYRNFPKSAFVYTSRSMNVENRIEYNTAINNWVYCPKENEDESSTTTILSNSDSIVSTNTSDKLNNFKEVYPQFKKTYAGVVARIDSNGERTLVLGQDLSQLGDVDQVTCNDSWTDVSYDSERGLYHGQPVWVKVICGETYDCPTCKAKDINYYSDDDHCSCKCGASGDASNFIRNGVYTRAVDFFSTKDSVEGFYTGEPVIEEISLETLKTLPFIWEQYLAFIKENK